MRKILQTSSFKKNVKKLHNNQKSQLDEAVKLVLSKPEIGTQKKGDLAKVFVYKFKIQNQETLLAYEYDEESTTLLSIGSHENFYRDLKK